MTLDDDWWTDPDDPPTLTHQHPREFNALLALYEQHAPQRVLEIGAWHGGTLKQWIKRAPRGAVVVAIDPGILGVWHDWAHAQGVRLECLAGRSQDQRIIDAARRFGPYDFVFIDGDHNYEAVKADFENYRTMMAPHGMMAFHDILAHPRYPGNHVRRVWDEIVEAGYTTYELIENTAFSWGGIGIATLGDH